MKEFFAKYPGDVIGMLSRRQIERTIESNIDWLLRSRDIIFNWLRQRTLYDTILWDDDNLRLKTNEEHIASAVYYSRGSNA